MITCPNGHWYDNTNGRANENRPVLTLLLGGCYQVGEAPTGSLRDFRLQGAGLSHSHCQRSAQREGDSGHPDEGQTKCNVSDFYDPAC